ncbi:MAG: hypothetical protein NEA02_13215 [Thermoanaerobaculia bacterium]|nr:hypothetical protein [Thermoanaerobaculia bacterium]
MKVRLALAPALALSLGLSAMPTAVEYLPAKTSLPQAAKLGDGSVLPAGPYDVQIHFKGYGNAAELWFFQRDQLKGKSPAEARGFPSAAPGAAASASTLKQQKADGAKIHDKGEISSPKVDDAAAQKGINYPKMEATDKQHSPANAPAAFSWEKAGFQKGQKGIVTPGPPGKLKLSFDSANSAAGIIAILPYVEKQGK